MYISHIIGGKVVIECHICPARNGRIIKYPAILCSLCMGKGSVEISMTEEGIDEYNRGLEEKQ